MGVGNSAVRASDAHTVCSLRFHRLILDIDGKAFSEMLSSLESGKSDDCHFH